MKKTLLFCASILISLSALFAQEKLSIDKVVKTYLRNSGTIMENNQIKGYFLFYQSDKIDKKTNEYTLQILDQNLNKVKEVQFEDSKTVSLLESAYNGKSLSFLFKNSKEKTLEMKIYDLSGNLKYSYVDNYDKRTDYLMSQYETMHTDEGTNQNVFDMGERGFISVLPLRDGNHRTYQVKFYSSDDKKQWSYEPQDDEEKYAMAEYMGSYGNVVILEVLKKARALSGKMTSHLVGINVDAKKKVFELDASNDTWAFVPSTVIPLKERNEMLIMGNYFDKADDVVKDFSKGLALYVLNGDGKVISKTYNSWEKEFSKYLPTNQKGKIDELGYLYIHKMIPTPDGKLFVVGEGYKRQANAAGIALKTLSVLAGGGGRTGVGVTKIVVTDMVVMEFDKQFKLSGAQMYEKKDNVVEASTISDYNSQHLIALAVKMNGGFDYEFTTGDADNSNFSICYSDYVKDGDYKGQTFNAIHYNGSKFSQDKIELKSKASRMKVFPAKAGSVMIMEYFKKDKRIDLRMEKLG